jgi:hypothetical protein
MLTHTPIRFTGAEVEPYRTPPVTPASPATSCIAWARQPMLIFHEPFGIMVSALFRAGIPMITKGFYQILRDHGKGNLFEYWRYI